jgi:hypothetical protein
LNLGDWFPILIRIVCRSLAASALCSGATCAQAEERTALRDALDRTNNTVKALEQELQRGEEQALAASEAAREAAAAFESDRKMWADQLAEVSHQPLCYRARA